MATELLSLFAKIGIDDNEYTDGLKNAETNATKFSNGLKTAFKVGAAAVAATTAAVIGLSKALIDGVADTAEYGDNVDKMSQKMGISATAYQEWDAVMQHSGTSMETLKASMKTLANAVESGNDAFQRIGITQEQIANMNQEELFNATITGLQNISDETERTYLAGQLLGRGATELGALLNTSAEDTQAMKDRVHELNGVMSDEAVKSAAKFQDQLQDMQTAMDGLKRTMLSEFMPSLTTVMSGLTEIFSGNIDEGLEEISTGIGGVVAEITTKMPEAMRIGGEILLALASSIVENLPVLLDEAVIPTIMALTTGIIDMLPDLLDVGMQILFSLTTGLTDAISEGGLVETAMQVVTELANGFAENLPAIMQAAVDLIVAFALAFTEPDTLMLLIDAAINLILALTEGLIQALPQLVAAVPQITENIFNTLLQALPKLLNAGTQFTLMLGKGIMSMTGALLSNVASIGTSIWNGFKGVINKALGWGRDLINNFVSGITEKWNALKSKVTGVADYISGLFHHSTPDFGPLKDDDKWFSDMMDNFINGIDKKMPEFRSTLDGLSSEISGTIQADTDVELGGGFGGVTVIQNNTYSNPHTDYELWKSNNDLRRTVGDLVRGAV